MQWRLSASPSIPPRPESPGDHPRVDVSWYAAVAFCRWLSRQVPYEVRLVGEREWIRAARGDDDRLYPWGSDDPGDQHANCCDLVGGTTAVGRYPDGASPFGVEDMAGNVWEWCIEDYGTQIRDLDFKSRFRSIRGGCYTSGPKWVRIDACDWHDPAEGSETLGFRLVRAILPGG
ncbi:MAG: SUMF1/EgtB/PvdO family nonheme iron enzyme [Anaerolineae bacterium]|nr:SUMF1/EgtB/PvdO family nonheme iron enzyme [Anaerolineae bacterium]